MLFLSSTHMLFMQSTPFIEQFMSKQNNNEEGQGNYIYDLNCQLTCFFLNSDVISITFIYIFINLLKGQLWLIGP